MLAIQYANKKERDLARIRKGTQEASQALKKRRLELMSMESVLETRHTLKRYTPEMLGQGKAHSGGPAARKLRYEVLERISKLGTSLSAAQRNDWAWFREAWDTKMCNDHGKEWGGTFSTWMQKLLDDISEGLSNAFSVFVHNETNRNFHAEAMLVVPGSNY